MQALHKLSVQWFKSMSWRSNDVQTTLHPVIGHLRLLLTRGSALRWSSHLLSMQPSRLPAITLSAASPNPGVPTTVHSNQSPPSLIKTLDCSACTLFSFSFLIQWDGPGYSGKYKSVRYNELINVDFPSPGSPTTLSVNSNPLFADFLYARFATLANPTQVLSLSHGAAVDALLTGGGSLRERRLAAWTAARRPPPPARERRGRPILRPHRSRGAAARWPHVHTAAGSQTPLWLAHTRSLAPHHPRHLRHPRPPAPLTSNPLPHRGSPPLLWRGSPELRPAAPCERERPRRLGARPGARARRPRRGGAGTSGVRGSGLRARFFDAALRLKLEVYVFDRFRWSGHGGLCWGVTYKLRG